MQPQQHTRRNFLKGLAALVGGVALEQAIPFNRVWSFPKDIKVVNFWSTNELAATGPLTPKMVEYAYQDVMFGMDEPDLMLLSHPQFAAYFPAVWIDSSDPRCGPKLVSLKDHIFKQRRVRDYLRGRVCHA